ncbi:peptide ABC transporter substrate-binding protein [Candidatus Kaiserbacteria bacterium]|nr:peptide ABC transporter substrate-binding protein [Candidatus Kaiserbacteria bacterium]
MRVSYIPYSMEESHSIEISPQDSTDRHASSHISWRRFEYLSDLMRHFSPSERLALYICSIFLAISAFFLLVQLNDAFLVSVPEQYGTFTEGEVGPARFVNPILAVSSADKDMAQLVYSGLMRALPDGSLVPDLAESHTISANGTIYTFKIRPDATFHDGTPVTSADVAFTVKAAQNAALKSPRQANWVGVSVATPDAHTVIFTLPRAYAPFIEDTAMGILPQHLWKNISDQDFPYNTLNTHPIGSGPYMVVRADTDSTGSVTRYELRPFRHFTLGMAHLRTLTLAFYPNTEALTEAFKAGDIDAIAGVNPADVSRLASRADTAVLKAILPRIFGVFFNQNHNPALADLAARRALDAAVDKQAIVDSVLHGYGAVIDGPIPQGMFGTDSPAVPHVWTPTATTSITEAAAHVAKAREILTAGGWKFNDTTGVWEKGSLKLSLVLTTADEPELVATAETVATQWRAAGISVEVRIYPISDFNTTILRPRNYDAILFGEVVGRGGDLFAFWDSSQRNDPGLNFSMYANSQASSLLSKARATSDMKTRESLYAQFAEIIKKDAPAVFLYSPAFIYILPSSLHGIEIGSITLPSERFLNVYQWYTQTERVWSIFAKQEAQQQ